MKRLAVLWLLGLLTALRSQAGDDLSIRYASAPNAAPLHIGISGRTISAGDGTGAPAWTSVAGGTAAADAACAGRAYLTLLREDRNGDGYINAAAGERARLFISASWQAGGTTHSALIALDLSLPGVPRVLWQQTEASLPGLAVLAAAPTVARVRIGRDNRDPQQQVLLLGAGLPRAASAAQAARTGATLYAIDAQDGRVLWSASADAGSQRFPAMQSAFAAGITALDVTADGYADRLYAGDWGAALWRFDIAQGATANALMTGGVFAQLADPAQPSARGFLAAVDVAPVVVAGTAAWFNLSIGSAATGAGSTGQALFVLRDRQPFQSLTQAAFDALHPVQASELPTLTPAAAGLQGSDTAGFRIDLGSDQVLARALTADNVLLYTQVSSTTAPMGLCSTTPPTVIVKVSAVSAVDGRVALDLNTDTQRDAADLAHVLPAGTPPTAGVSLTAVAPGAAQTRCSVGDTVLAACPSLPRLKRTFWRREDAD